MIGSSDKEQCGGGKEEARVSAESIQGEKSKNGQCLVLKQGNVATLEATSLRYREELCQRRDVRGNIATFHRMLLNNVATLDINVATLLRLLIINVAMLESHVATFQRSSKSMSRRWELTSRRSRGWKNQRHDVGNPRRDVLETLKINVATFKSHVATFPRRVKLTSRRCDLTSRRYRKGF